MEKFPAIENPAGAIPSRIENRFFELDEQRVTEVKFCRLTDTPFASVVFGAKLRLSWNFCGSEVSGIALIRFDLTLQSTLVHSPVSSDLNFEHPYFVKLGTSGASFDSVSSSSSPSFSFLAILAVRNS